MFLILIRFGIIEFGRVLFITNSLNNAAREVARRAAVTPSPWNDTTLPAIEAPIRTALPFDTGSLEFIVTPERPLSGSGASISVTASLPFETIVGGVLPWLDLTLRGQATFRYEL